MNANNSEQKGKQNQQEQHKVKVYVDGELYMAPQRTMTPNEIITGATSLDTSKHYLLFLKKPDNISYENKGDEPIHLHSNMKFLVISTGSTPVSAPVVARGASAFIEGLKALNFAPKQLQNNPNHVYFEYIVECGKFKDTNLRIGLIIPPDFPMIAPTGPHISPEIHPINTSGQHPLGAIHKQHSLPFEAGVGGRWQYWSRPFKDWNTSKRSVATYMSHIAKLWASQ